MRALLIVILLAIAAPAAAQEGAKPAPVEIKPGHTVMVPEPIAVDEPRSGPRPKPSGYWTGYRPARAGAYKWNLMGIATIVLAITVFFVVRLLRKASRRPTS